MLAVICYPVALVSIVLAFFMPHGAWIPIGLLDLFILITWRSLRHSPPPVALTDIDISDKARELFAQFGHFYTQPWAGSDYSQAASGMTLASIPMGLIGVFKGDWWGVGIAILNYLVMGYVSMQFNPTRTLTTVEEQAAHNELLAAVQMQQSLNRPSGSV